MLFTEGDVLKIEKINDVQIKVLLDGEDLASYDVKLTELAASNDKTRSLFHCVMELAEEQYGFDAKDTPLIIEAVPTDANRVTVVITKVPIPREIEEMFAQLPFAKLGGRFKTKEEYIQPTRRENRGGALVFSFTEMDDLIAACARVKRYSDGGSVYKHEGKYFIVLDEEADLSKAEAIFAEYGNRHTANKLTASYLRDHGEEIIKADALQILGVL